MKKIICVLFLIAGYTSYASTNLEIQDSLAAEFAENIAELLNSEKISALAIEVKSHDAEWLVTQKLNNRFVKDDIKLSDSAGSKLTVIIKRIAPVYKLIDDSKDSASRKIKLSMEFNLKQNDRILHSDSFKKTYRDNVSRDKYQLLENNDYKFTQGDMPAEDLGFMEKYIEPVIVVSAAVLSVYLFFSIRSN